jgi:ABC-2 type transport system permease protein
MSAIYKRELRAYFTTPMGYVFCAMFLTLTNVFFYLGNVLYSYGNLSSIFFIMLVLLALTTPILTMRLFSEEYRQKTDQLLLTSPVRPIDIVAGKYLSAMTVVAISFAATLVFPLIVAIYGTPNGGQLLGNYLALLCAASAFVSIGLLISSVTENQIVSLLGTMGVLVFLYLLYLITDSFVPASWVWLHAFVQWFSPFTRFVSFTEGVFPLNEIVFYVTLAALFLFLTSRVLDKKRWEA